VGFWGSVGDKKRRPEGRLFFSLACLEGLPAPKTLFGFWSAETSKTLLEAIDTAAYVQHFLLAGVERVALGADVQAQWLAQSGAGLDDVTAGAGGVNGFVRWMNISFHGYFLGLGMPPLNTIVEYRTQLGRAY
jgi:hypothetical protein